MLTGEMERKKACVDVEMAKLVAMVMATRVT
jgi:hypothetical protein